MISGHATENDTRDHADRFPKLDFRRLGRTGLQVSAAGFGGYRVSAAVPYHASALTMALTQGINLVDTSANYGDGGSERLVGEVLRSLIASGQLIRGQVVVVSKGGYLQGENLALSRQRETEGRPFPEQVEYGDGLAHCIHPDFLADQIDRSLDRLGLATLDGYLLHNPEYYLKWAAVNHLDLQTARAEYDRRIENAFRHLETEVANGRLGFYGVSSNTFPAAAGDADFTSLARVAEIAQSLGPDHHFRMIQLPFNLLESDAALEKNQPGGKTLLTLALEKGIGVVTNRPLNAFSGKRMLRLADVDVRRRMDYPEIIDRIKALAGSETRLWRSILPGMDQIPGGLKVRIKQQGCVAETLKHHWRSFGSFERWRQARDGIFLPRIQGVIDFLRVHAANDARLADWLVDHQKALDRAFRAVASIYADEAVATEKKIRAAIAAADAVWDVPDTLSRKAVRSLTSTAGVSSVLVGMRRETYVRDVLGAIVAGVDISDRRASWRRLKEATASLRDTGS